MKKKILIVADDHLATHTAALHTLSKRTDVEVVSLDEAKEQGLLDNGSSMEFKSLPSITLPDVMEVNDVPLEEIGGRRYGKTHMQDLQSKIQRQASKTLKELNYGVVKKSYSGPKYTPKKKKRK